MKLSHVIEVAFGTAARISVLRRLASVEQPLSGRQLAELTGLTHRGAILAITPLVEEGVVKLRKAGRAHQYTLARKNIIVEKIILPALHEEEGLRSILKQELINAFAAETETLVLFGSFARGEETSASDLDLLAIAATDEKKHLVENLSEQCAPIFEEKFSAPLSLHCLSIDEIHGLKQSAFLKTVSHEGILLSGKTVGELMGSGKTKDKKRKQKRC